MTILNKPSKATIIEAVDELYPSPQDRAKHIWSLIQTSPSLRSVTDWDLLCFCVEYIAMQSQQFLFIEEESKHLVNLLYAAHYLDRTTDHDKSTGSPNISRRASEGRIPDGRESINPESAEKFERKSEIIGDLIIEKGSDAR